MLYIEMIAVLAARSTSSRLLEPMPSAVLGWIREQQEELAAEQQAETDRAKEEARTEIRGMVETIALSLSEAEDAAQEACDYAESAHSLAEDAGGEDLAHLTDAAETLARDISNYSPAALDDVGSEAELAEERAQSALGSVAMAQRTLDQLRGKI